jgi:hypothetical protein
MTDYDNQIKNILAQINENDSKKLLLVVPESAGDIFLATSLLEDLKQSYKEFEIYFACKPQFKDILLNNPYITTVIDYLPVMDNQIVMEGTGNWKGIFDISIMLTIFTQRYLNYINNGLTRISLNLRN